MPSAMGPAPRVQTMPDKTKGILLESGTNELEALVFTLGKLRCGVNVAKVREVIGLPQRTHVPMAHPAVIGVANLRGRVIPLVDLQLYFTPGQDSACDDRHVVITEFNNVLLGFVVDGVEQIYRLGWDQVEPAPHSSDYDNAAVTSICHVGDQLVLMVDFEKIAFDIQGTQMAADQIGEAAEGFDRQACRILLAEDSQTMRNFMVETLKGAGYGQVKSVGDGADAWAELESSLQKPSNERYDLMISDIEMPRMDGLHLCRRVREHAELRDMPVVIFSSLVSEDNEKKTSAVGADATLTKPQLGRLVEFVDRLLTRQPVEA
jgi:two-component system chemotaxis response regulator CheV